MEEEQKENRLQFLKLSNQYLCLVIQPNFAEILSKKEYEKIEVEK